MQLTFNEPEKLSSQTRISAHCDVDGTRVPLPCQVEGATSYDVPVIDGEAQVAGRGDDGAAEDRNIEELHGKSCGGDAVM